MAAVRCNEALSATVTQLLVPLNDRARPYFPAKAQLAPLRVPVNPPPELSAVDVPDPSSNPYAATKAGTARPSSSSTRRRRLLSGRRHLADRRMNIELLQSTI